MSFRYPAGQVLILVLACTLFLVPALAGNDVFLEPFRGMEGTLRIAGGTAHIPFMQEAAGRIMRFNPAIRITVAGGGSGAGIKQVGEGLVDLGDSGRKATDSEIARYGLKIHELALDGVGVIVNPRNRVRSLSTAQLRGIYSGRIVNWKELGGDDAGITVYTRDSASGTREVFLELALDREPITDRAQFAVSNGAVKAAVSQDPDAIGYISAGFIDGSVRGVSLDGIAPEIGNIRQGIYPVSRILYTNTKGEPEGLARKMIDYLLSPEGRMIIEEKGFIPIR